MSKINDGAEVLENEGRRIFGKQVLRGITTL
jgi:hypothetical protein